MIPGPGAYQPKTLFIKNRPASTKIGLSSRYPVSDPQNPGPGHYEQKIIRPESAKTVIGKASRLKVQK